MNSGLAEASPMANLVENCTTSLKQHFNCGSFRISLNQIHSKQLRDVGLVSSMSVCPPRCRIQDLRILAAGRRSDLHHHHHHAKDLRRKKQRDFSKSQSHVALEAPSPRHVSQTLDEEHIQLNPDQAIGQIVSAQANFMRVIVQRPGPEERDVSTNLQETDADHTEEDSDIRTHATRVFQTEYHNDAEDEKVGRELLCVVRALLKKIKRRVMVGDKVLVSGIDWIDGRGMIEEVFDRKCETSDPPVANVDQIIVLSALDCPRTEPLSLSRFLIEAESTGIPFIVAFNKTDLASLEDVSKWKKRLKSWGYEPVFCSAAMRSGIESLMTILMNKTSVIIGPSGVGKSSIINALRDQSGTLQYTCESEVEVQFENQADWEFDEQMVGDVSERTGRGKHTTRNVNLLRLPNGGYLADTPGFNQPSLVKVTTKSLPSMFPEIRNRASEQQCAFSDCLHTEEPDCAVGGDWERYGHYLQLLEELRKREEVELRTFGTKRESEVRYKVKAFGVKQAEPRLTPKKHRRVSRQREKISLVSEIAEEVQEWDY